MLHTCAFIQPLLHIRNQQIKGRLIGNGLGPVAIEIGHNQPCFWLSSEFV